MIHLFTHTDLDGISCEVVAKAMINEEIATYPCDYNNIDDELTNFIDGYDWHEEDYILITDISPSEETAAKLNDFRVKENIELQLLDHHATAESLNKYSWAKVCTTLRDRMTCGTELLNEWLKNSDYVNINRRWDIQYPGMVEFVEYVRLYDTFDWTKSPDGERARSFNLLHKVYGRKFTQRMLTYYMNRPGIKLDEADRRAVDELRMKEMQSLEAVKQRMIIRTMWGYKVGVYFSYGADSIVSYYLLKERTDIDFVIIVNTAYNKLEFRTAKEDIDLGKQIASKYLGGGHPKAAGATITNEMIEIMLDAFVANRPYLHEED